MRSPFRILLRTRIRVFLCYGEAPTMQNIKIFKMPFASVYPHYIAKAEKSRFGDRDNGHTKAELHTIIHWLTGYDEKALQQLLDNKIDFETFLLRRDETSSPRHPR